MSDATAFPASTPGRIGPGTRLSDIYEIDRLIATGGMGEVFKGHAIETGDDVAIKTIRPELAQNAAALALFRKEAQALHNLYHQAIVRYFVFTVDRTLGIPYLAMEYVVGEPLTDRLAREPMPIDALQVLQCRLAHGLGAAHELGIVHRDVSPDNVILPGGDVARAKIIDFGIARSKLGEGTVIGDGFAGKYGYVSPEQLGLYGGDVTGQSDIYSLGLVLAEAALGRRLDMGSSHADVIEKRRAVPDLTGIDPRIRPLLESMLQPDPKNRPASMAEIANCPPSGAQTIVTPAARPGRRRSALFAGLGALGLAAAGGAAFFASGLGPGSSPTRPAEPGTTTNRREPETLLPAEPPSTPPSRVPSGDAPGGRQGGTPTSTTTGTPPPGDAAPDRIAPPPTFPPPGDPAASPPTMERVADFVRGYRGGPCFYISPVSISAREAVIDGLGNSLAPFVALDGDFARAMGFEPSIHLRQVTDAQCPVVDLLASGSGGRSPRAPKVTLAGDAIRNGEELSGTVEVWPDAQVEIFLVADDGVAQRITGLARRTGTTASFRVRLDGGRESKPQLVLAVASSKPLPGLRPTARVPADRLMIDVASEIARPGGDATIGVRYFKLGG